MLALVFGAGFSALAVLLLNLKTAIASVILSLVLLPGFLFASLPFRSREFYSPIGVLAVNSIIYAGVAYFLLARYFSRLSARRPTFILSLFTVPSIALVSLASVPSLNPMWPRMDQVIREENDLRHGIPVGTNLEQARSFLRMRDVEFQEEKIDFQKEIPQRGGPPILVLDGERFLSARIITDSGQFPCGYAIELGLLFDSTGILKENRVNRLRLCP